MDLTSGEPNAPPQAICGPITQRLISALMEENIVTSLQDTMESEGIGTKTNTISTYGIHLIESLFDSISLTFQFLNMIMIFNFRMHNLMHNYYDRRKC